MRHRSPVRYLAPVALVATVAAVWLVVKAGTTAKSRVATRPVAPVVVPRPSQRFHVVKPRETLSGIAARFGVTVTELEQLNPSLDPNALRPGQVVKLRA